MDTKTQLDNGLKDAMRSQDDLRKRTLRMVRSAIQMAEIEKSRPLEEAEVLAILQKEVKSRQESIEEAQRAGRSELAAASQDEIGVLETYLPRQLTQAELEALVRQVIAEVGASEPRDMGKVMKVLNPRLQGRATGSQASQMVRELLQG